MTKIYMLSLRHCMPSGVVHIFLLYPSKVCYYILLIYYILYIEGISPPMVLFNTPIHLKVNNYRLSMKCIPHKKYLNYKWERRNNHLPSRAQGAYTSHLVIVNLRPEDAGDYRCVVSNSTGTISSRFYSLVINGTYGLWCTCAYMQVHRKFSTRVGTIS